MPPELLSEGRISAACDVYSFGVLLYEMWTGRSAWQGCAAPQVMHLVTSDAARLLMPDDAPPGLRVRSVGLAVVPPGACIGINTRCIFTCLHLRPFVPPSGPAARQKLCERCLAYDPRDRPSIEQVVEAVAALMAAESAAARGEGCTQGGYLAPPRPSTDVPPRPSLDGAAHRPPFGRPTDQRESFGDASPWALQQHAPVASGQLLSKSYFAAFGMPPAPLDGGEASHVALRLEGAATTAPTSFFTSAAAATEALPSAAPQLHASAALGALHSSNAAAAPTDVPAKHSVT